jgi:hypothetical protein
MFRPIPILSAFFFFVACSKTPGVAPSPSGGGPSGADTTTRIKSTRLTADSVTGYYKVTETTISTRPSFLWVPSKSYLFAAEIKKQNDSAIQLYQSMRSPLVYWTYDWGLSIRYDLNDSLTNGPALAWGRIINDSTVNFHYQISSYLFGPVYTVTQQWTKLRNAADTALYGFKDTVRNKVTTIAGTGVAGYTGNEGAATQAELSGPCDVRFDAQNNLYICDGWNGSIRVVDPSGIIHLFAGGNASSNDTRGDGGPATSAEISANNIAIDPSGIVYLAEQSGRVRKITKDGLINTIAGSWVTTLLEFGNYSYCGDYGPALQAAMTPSGVCLDQQGNLLVADYYNNRIRKVFYP